MDGLWKDERKSGREQGGRKTERKGKDERSEEEEDEIRRDGEGGRERGFFL